MIRIAAILVVVAIGFGAVASKAEAPLKDMATTATTNSWKHDSVVDYISLQDGQTFAYLPQAVENDPLAIEGFIYLTDSVEDAWESLNGVKSAFDSSREARTRVGVRYVITLALVEHTPWRRFFSATNDQGREEIVLELLREFGTKYDQAWRTEGSPAGARGVMQFMELTYNRLQEAYPEAGLPQRGFLQHYASFRAAFLLSDETTRWRFRNPTAYEQISDQDSELLRVASYNCSGSFVHWRAFEKYNDDWKKVLPDETRNYLEMYVWVRNYLFPPTT